jgi:hypothetical protein
MMLIPSHELKADPLSFAAIWNGQKTFDVRRDDRGFLVNDVLWLRETCSSAAEMAQGQPLDFTHRGLAVRVRHIVCDAYGLPDGLAVLGIEVVARWDDRRFLAPARDDLAATIDE